MPERPPTVTAYISAGSSIRPRQNLPAALEMLCESLDVTGVSTVRRTAAIGRPADPDFFNCVFEVRTALPPRTLKFQVLGGIEDRLGRYRDADPYAPRRIDLDLLLHDQTVVSRPDLTLPHPDLGRWFVRAAVLELAPRIELPGQGPLAHLDGGDEGIGEATIVTDLTDLLRSRAG